MYTVASHYLYHSLNMASCISFKMQHLAIGFTINLHSFSVLIKSWQNMQAYWPIWNRTVVWWCHVQVTKRKVFTENILKQKKCTQIKTHCKANLRKIKRNSHHNFQMLLILPIFYSIQSRIFMGPKRQQTCMKMGKEIRASKGERQTLMK